MADNIKQIKVEGVSYDLNAKYIQDGSGNPKTWQNIADMINAGVKLVTDNARKEAAGDGAIGAPATTAAVSTMGKITSSLMMAVFLVLTLNSLLLIRDLIVLVHLVMFGMFGKRLVPLQLT